MKVFSSSAGVLPHACCWYAFVPGQDPAPASSSTLLLLKGHKSEVVITAMKCSVWDEYTHATVSGCKRKTVTKITTRPQLVRSVHQQLLLY